MSNYLRVFYTIVAYQKPEDPQSIFTETLDKNDKKYVQDCNLMMDPPHFRSFQLVCICLAVKGIAKAYPLHPHVVTHQQDGIPS